METSEVEIVGSLELWPLNWANIRLGLVRVQVEFYHTVHGMTTGVVYVPAEVTATKSGYITLTSAVAYIENLAGGAILRSARML